MAALRTGSKTDLSDEDRAQLQNIIAGIDISAVNHDITVKMEVSNTFLMQRMMQAAAKHGL